MLASVYIFLSSAMYYKTLAIYKVNFSCVLLADFLIGSAKEIMLVDQRWEKEEFPDLGIAVTGSS